MRIPDENEAWLSNIEIEYSIDATVNIGNFQNVKPGYRIKVTLANDINPDWAKDKITKKVNEWLEAAVEDIKKDLE